MKKKIACFVCDSQHQRVIFLFPPSSWNMVRFDLFNGAMLTSFLIDIKRDDNKWVKRRRLTFNFSFLNATKQIYLWSCHVRLCPFDRRSVCLSVSRSLIERCSLFLHMCRPNTKFTALTLSHPFISFSVPNENAAISFFFQRVGRLHMGPVQSAGQRQWHVWKGMASWKPPWISTITPPLWQWGGWTSCRLWCAFEQSNFTVEVGGKGERHEVVKKGIESRVYNSCWNSS